ncbi:hypothetical protein [Yimella lutea]|uniref:hypothetical protein n=1 Tax=Yimella lutea TaxID=587872 RepID=UPI001154492D|nr:hypothetical protein [Yimella lutea]
MLRLDRQAGHGYWAAVSTSSDTCTFTWFRARTFLPTSLGRGSGDLDVHAQIAKIDTDARDLSAGRVNLLDVLLGASKFTIPNLGDARQEALVPDRGHRGAFLSGDDHEEGARAGLVHTVDGRVLPLQFGVLLPRSRLGENRDRSTGLRRLRTRRPGAACQHKNKPCQRGTKSDTQSFHRYPASKLRRTASGFGRRKTAPALQVPPSRRVLLVA